MKNRHAILLASLFAAVSLRADGLLMPTDSSYPKDFLRNRMTHLSVRIRGLLAETFVYQEFVNESNKPVNAVYSFPLPPEARATEFLYWSKGKVYSAVLKVREQVVNPGTGEGGVAAKVNDYIGRNGIKIEVKDIPADSIQAVRLRYISVCDFDRGRCTYAYPLNTDEFVDYPLEHLWVTFDFQSNNPITSFDLPTHPGFKMLEQTSDHIRMELNSPKTYVNQDLEFWYETDKNKLGVDFYSVLDDTAYGHFALFVRPQDETEPAGILPKRVFFLLNNSNRMTQSRLTQYVSAISLGLDQLSDSDAFNLIIFNHQANSWKTEPVQATAENRASAKSFLASISASWGTQMDIAVKEAFNQIHDENKLNCIVAFTDGYTTVDPKEIESLNRYKAGIFPVGLGAEVSRARLEMTAGLNYGFVTYFEEWDENLGTGMAELFRKISRPLLKNVVMEFGRADLTDLLPEKFPATFAGASFYMTGGYRNAGPSSLALAGESTAGVVAYDFQLDFSGRTDTLSFAAELWAKESIDALEREIEIYGETQELKDRLIGLSLKYNIRCRYTAYIADYTTEWPGEGASGIESGKVAHGMPVSCLLGNYPNPCNPETTIRFFLSASSKSKVKLIKVFNLLGKLVAVIDISGLAPGFHEVRFNGRDFWGKPLQSGLYVLRLEAGMESHAIRIVIVR
jgi:Ca-activated chloride channel homolog